MQRLSELETELAQLTAERQAARAAEPVLCVYGDSAYTETRHVARSRPWALSSAAERHLNDIMKPVRVLVEQNFAIVTQLAGIGRVKLSLGSGPVGMVFPVCVLLTNVHTLLYGNTVSCSVPGANELLPQVTVEDYLSA